MGVPHKKRLSPAMYEAKIEGKFRTNTGFVFPDFDPNVDSNCDDVVGIPDFNMLRSSFGKAAGPSGLSCAGSPPCTP